MDFMSGQKTCDCDTVLAEKRKLQKLILSIAEEVIQICEKNNINYYLGGGSFLGAVRHKGFIPWDDDMDLFMKRSDYTRFLKICSREIDKQKYFVQTEDTEDMYGFSFAKIQLRGTEIVENFSKEVKIQHGIFLDIFPIDNLPDETLKKKWMLCKNHILKNMIWVRCGYGTEKQKQTFRYKLCWFGGLFFSVRLLKRMRYNLITKYNGMESEYCFNSDFPKEIYRSDWFADPVEYEFEHRRFKGFKEYDRILRHQYGDYMTLPPEGDRQQHSMEKIDFGPYGN